MRLLCRTVVVYRKQTSSRSEAACFSLNSERLARHGTDTYSLRVNKYFPKVNTAVIMRNNKVNKTTKNTFGAVHST